VARPLGTDCGIDEYQPVDAVRMARGESRRYGSTERVSGDMRLR
jgi:hypothetical protein